MHKDDKSNIDPGRIVGSGTHVTGKVFFSGTLYQEGGVHGGACALPTGSIRERDSTHR
jgi:hypothetical protein